MKTLSNFLVASLAVSLLGFSSASADHEVRRIDHPNGPPTFIAAPHEHTSATIGVYAGERGVGRRDTEIRRTAPMKDPAGRTQVPLHRGRGEVTYVPVEK